jgi:branched-chain amino acid transport system ATP-binding protein
MLSLRSVSSGYGGAVVNRDVDLEVGDGEIVALIGRNGVGKTTLAKTIIGLQPAMAGSVIFDGVDMTSSDARRRARAGIGYVPQGRGIFPDLTVEENLVMGRSIGAAAKSFDHVFGLFPILKQRRRQLGGTMSGGQQQMLAIGRVLMGEPRILVLDEPSDGIQPNIVDEIGELCRRLNEDSGLAILLIEQHLDLILACAHRCLVMERGMITKSMSPRDLEDPRIARQALAI